ncbi:B3 domain-containing protein Os01g0234100-like isoform X2 [Amaranthus tricolor]|uniref:B3 domain-containing protein Os01g0234100-like isoform X2 n=1 Tax=Amaranthus tricolor TaxID=29722 RepID=UPI0025826DE9|nr:B3 domain-containing protein Os01g0234100-like isoform X2 [Amaranthus tricolor]
MSEGQPKNMPNFDHSSSTSISPMKKEKSSMSKKELKLSLVAQRLAMLQDDDYQPFPVSSTKIPDHCESYKRLRLVNLDESFTENGELNACTLSTPNERSSSMKQTGKVQSNLQAKNGELGAGSITTIKERSSSMKEAEKVNANLSAKYPSFIKFMLKSHVSGGFWLGLPSKFCDNHLPIHDTKMVLVDEAGQEFDTTYLAGKKGLSAGWRGFSIHQNLHAGDALVFHLIAPTKFKIYIIREQNLGEVDRVLGLPNIDYSSLGKRKSEDSTQKVILAEHSTQKVLRAEDSTQKILRAEDSTQKVLQAEDDQYKLDYPYQSSSENDLGSEVHDGIHFSDSAIAFEGVNDFESFSIIVDGLVIDSKFSDCYRKKYYELCSSQKYYLHENLLEGLNCNLVVGIISETINIADGISSCEARLSISREDLRIWEKTLEGFECLGMKVGFLRARAKHLLGRAVESNEAEESRKLKESIIKRAFVGETMKALDDKFTLLKGMMQKIDLELESKFKKLSGILN